MSKKPVRKPGAGKPASKPGGRARAPKVSARRERLEEELQEAIRQIDEQGLAFLLNQAHDLIHNAQV